MKNSTKSGVEFVDCYHMVWCLREEDGSHTIEEHHNISLSDFEIVYGNNLKEILFLNMMIEGRL